ncbi:MAG TPA: HAD family phosphatase [Nitrospirota bacterium]|nr:HAD family phosphatase [Nitrospirota bacterium]
MRNAIKAVLFDFGGVIAEEGFFKGLLEISRMIRLNADTFFTMVDDAIVETGYLTGKVDESAFWDVIKKEAGISIDESILREEILKQYVIRPEIILYADYLRSNGIIAAVLSDQTNWLDEINQITSFFQHFDRIFNSYHSHKSKRDASVFQDVCEALKIKPGETLFIDDNKDHIRRARGEGLKTIHFVSIKDFRSRIQKIIRLDFTSLYKQDE